MDLLLSGLARKYPENASIQFLVEHEIELNFVLLGHITEVYGRMPQEEFFPHLMRLLEGVAYFYGKYQDIDDQDLRVNQFHADVDDIIARDLFGQSVRVEQVLCGKGCSGCCSQLVTVTASEAELLMKSAPAVDLERLSKQAQATLDNWTDHLTPEEGKCVFLDAQNGSCTVWAQRPANCRNYFVTGSNLHCSVFNRNPDVSRSLKSIMADVCISAFYSLEKGGQSMSEYLYRRSG